MRRLISCREAVQQLWRFLDQELDSAEQHSVEEHLEYCVHCCGELEFVRELRDVLGSQRTGYLPADVQDRLENFVDQLDDASAEEGTREDP